MFFNDGDGFVGIFMAMRALVIRQNTTVNVALRWKWKETGYRDRTLLFRADAEIGGEQAGGQSAAAMASPISRVPTFFAAGSAVE